MAKRKKHPFDAIERAVKYAESKGWEYRPPGGSAHAWGRVYCPLRCREGCAISIWSTPRNPEHHALQLIRRINKCPHKMGLKS